MKIQKIGYENQSIQKNQQRQKNVSFNRNWSEHVSWGANYVKETGKTNFKIFSFPDAKAVFVEVAKKVDAGLGNMKERVVQVLGTAGFGFVINDIISKDSDSQVYPMTKHEDGVFEANNVDAKPNDKYRYVIVDKNNNINIVKDPYAKKQDSIHGWSSVYNQDNYEWKNTDWLNGNDVRRITRKPKEKYRGLEKLIIDEVNIPTVSKEGTFEAAKARVDAIAKRGVATAIELLPVENTFSLQWGYDGVDKFAVNEKMGGAVGLKSFVDYAHGKGLNVIMDMVPNHMGPDGDYLSQTGPYERGAGQFGGEFNYEGENNRYVRDWMANAALWWVNEFKVDGLRLDMTKLCGSDFLLKQIVTEVNEHNPNVFIIAEDGRENKESVTRYDSSKSHKDDLDFIDFSVDNIAKRGWFSTPGNIGFDSEWDFRLMHAVKTAVLSSGANLLDDLDSKIQGTQHRVKYLMSHDEIGNEDGTRLIPKVIVRQLNLFFNTDGVSDAEKGQKAAHAGQQFAELVVSKDFENMSDAQLQEFERNIGIKTFISKDEILEAFNIAFAKHKLALGLIMSLPGPKMYFQGDESADLSYFKFFREFSDERAKREKSDDFKNNIIRDKGYDTLEEVARLDSLVGSIVPSGKFEQLPNQMEAFTSDMKQLVMQLPAISKGDIQGTYKDNNHNVHIHQLKCGKEEVLVIKNFGQGFHERNYQYYGFPEGSKWEEVFNSDDVKYGGLGFTNAGRKDIDAHHQNLSLAPNSFLILKKI